MIVLQDFHFSLLHPNAIQNNNFTFILLYQLIRNLVGRIDNSKRNE
jgi:hypothetical protein